MCSVHLYPYDCANCGSVDVFLHMGSMALVLWGVAAIIGNGYRSQGQNYVEFFPGSKMSAGFHHRNLILSVYCFMLIL